LKDAAGSAADQILIHRDHALIPFDWSMDGRFLLYGESMPATRFDLWIAPLTGAQKPFPFLHTAADELEGQFSPDGRWIAYTSDETGRDEVYVNKTVESGRSGRKWLVSGAGGAQPRWRRDGTELFYRSGGGVLTSVGVRATPAGLK